MTTDLYNIDKIIEYQIRRLNATSLMEYDEAFQIGYLGYLRAKNNFDSKKHKKMTLNYVVPYIFGDLLSALEKIVSNKAICEYDEATTKVVSEHERLWGNAENPTLDVRLNKLKALLRYLPKKERNIIKDVYFAERPLTLREIGKKYNLTKQRVYQIKAYALELLKKAYEKYE